MSEPTTHEEGRAPSGAPSTGGLQVWIACALLLLVPTLLILIVKYVCGL
jgi:hypothetical protein